MQNELQRAGNSETLATQETAPPVLNPNNAALNQVDRVEQLLAQLESKSLALVPYGYWNQPQAQAERSNQWLIAALLGCVWLSGLALAVVYFSSRQSSHVAERDVPTTPRIISVPSDQQDQKTAESVNSLTNALVNSSNRLDQIEAALQKSDLDFRQLKTKVGLAGTKPITRESESVPVKDESDAATTLSSTVGKSNQNGVGTLTADEAAAPAPRPLPSAPNMQAPPKTTDHVLSIKPTDSAIPHKADDGTIDYWLVARGGAFKELAKVQPIAVVANGVVIYNLDDGKNYTLTRQGEWLNVEW